jgi:hypothetical protein
MQWWRIGAIISGQLFLFAVVLKHMIFFMGWVEESAARDGCDDMCTVYPLLVYCVLTWAIGAAFNKLAVFFYTRDVDESTNTKEHYLIFSTFSFHFFNNNCGLMYATFYLRDFSILRYLLASLVIITTLCDYLLYEVYYEQPAASTQGTSRMLSLKGKSLLPTMSHRDADEMWKAVVIAELQRLKFHSHVQHLRLTTRYSFCCMFVVAFPITPLLMWLYNGMEPNLYLKKLKTCVRTSVVDCSSLSEWLTCFKFINFCAVIVNCFLLCIMTTDVSIIVPQKYEPLLESETNRLKLYLYIAHLVDKYGIVSYITDAIINSFVYIIMLSY